MLPRIQDKSRIIDLKTKVLERANKVLKVFELNEEICELFRENACVKKFLILNVFEEKSLLECSFFPTKCFGLICFVLIKNLCRTTKGTHRGRTGSGTAVKGRLLNFLVIENLRIKLYILKTFYFSIDEFGMTKYKEKVSNSLVTRYLYVWVQMTSLNTASNRSGKVEKYRQI